MKVTRRAAMASLWAASRLRGFADDPIVIPALLNDYRQIWIPVRINGSEPLWCELDTGGGGALIFIDAQKAAEIGVRATSAGRSAGPGESAMGMDGRAQVTVEFPGGLTLPKQDLIIKPKALGKDGIVGMYVFQRYVVEMDYETPLVRLHDAERFRYTNPAGKVILVEFDQTNPHTEAALTVHGGEEMRGRFVLDTGAAGSLIYLTKSFVDRTRLLDRGLWWAADNAGLNAARVERLTVGPFKVERPVIRRFLAPGFGGANEPDGLIGAEFLRRFRVFVDYGRKQMILEPNREYTQPSRFDASGIRVYRDPKAKHGMRIFLVLPSSPASEAGIREGDLLLAVDGAPVDRISPGLVQESLMREGADCVLLVQRKVEVLTFKLKLRALV